MPADSTSPEVVNTFIARWSSAALSERAAEEASGTIRHLRPEYQGRAGPPGPPSGQQSKLNLDTDSKSPARKPAKAAKLPWPKTMAERTKAIDTYLATEPQPITLTALTKKFSRAKEEDVLEILQTLTALSRAREVNRDNWVRQ